MASTLKVVGATSSVSSSPWTEAARRRWAGLRDVFGGALLLAAWLALWTVTWAAVAGPLRPAEAVRLDAAGAAQLGGAVAARP